MTWVLVNFSLSLWWLNLTGPKDEYEGDGGDEGVGDDGGGVCAFVLEAKKGGDEMSTENKKLVMSDAHWCPVCHQPTVSLKNHSSKSFVENLWKLICLISFLGNPGPYNTHITNFHHRYQLPITNTTPHQEEITNATPMQHRYQSTPRGNFKTKVAKNALLELCELVSLILFRVSLKSHCWALSGGKQWQIG